ncbi:hypothetical protein CLA01_04620 [Chryseobacterium lathyri]|jgi:hypothetical protein|uniref:Uncharacterized protein n=1 Tax=Chryseobacterium lathyri TaxID=395933 RepID=A0A511Y5B1_9FLAO|nr:hypothetical protein CLA01_04620 [Chryseobacterium lathyri]
MESFSTAEVSDEETVSLKVSLIFSISFLQEISIAAQKRAYKNDFFTDMFFINKTGHLVGLPIANIRP